jgi:haloacid dehalogenase-like hydrolase
MSAPQNVIAVIFDFDDTLTDDSTTKLLESKGIDPREFWQEKMPRLVSDGWDGPLAYLKLLLDNVGHDKRLGNLTNAALREFGKSLSFYPGIPELFTDLTALTEEHRLSRPVVEFYVISGGLEEIIRGSSIAEHFSGIWGCRLAEEGESVRHIKKAITFTEKTRYLFEINKGIADQARAKPYAVNEWIEPGSRRVPFGNMIYLGDGFTDVPCFSLLQNSGGTAIGVFDPRKKDAPKKAWEQLVAPRRVSTMNSPKYRHDDDLGALLRMAVKQICLKMDTRLGSAS